MIRERALKGVLVLVGLLFLAGVYPLWRLQLDPSEQMLGGVYATLEFSYCLPYVTRQQTAA
jgi:hypothetical protein